MSVGGIICEGNWRIGVPALVIPTIKNRGAMTLTYEPSVSEHQPTPPPPVRIACVPYDLLPAEISS